LHAHKDDGQGGYGYTFAGEHTLGGEFGVALGTSPKRLVEIDTAKYQKYLDDPSLSEGQKEEIIMALWSIITAFMDLGFGVNPAQQVHGPEAYGKPAEMLEDQGEEDSNVSKPGKKNTNDVFNDKSPGI